MKLGLFDLDLIKYRCSSVGQSNTIHVVHRQLGDEYNFKTRSEFYGRNKARDQGELAKMNALRDSPFLWDEFSITDVVTPEPIENVLHTVKLSVEGAVIASKVKDWKAFIGEGDSFRVELSTLLKYKGQRSQEKPYHYDAVVEYLYKKYKPEVCLSLETDDILTTLAYRNPDNVIIGCDKDYKTSDVLYFNILKPDAGVMNCSGFGKLHLTEKKEVDGYGRLFKYWQIISQDDADNYKANCFSDTPWADLSAYKALTDCTTDKECWSKMVEVFKMLYPEPKTVVGWREDDVLIDWKYVMQEMVNLSHMLRWEGDHINVIDVLTKLGVDYE